MYPPNPEREVYKMSLHITQTDTTAIRDAEKVKKEKKSR